MVPVCVHVYKKPGMTVGSHQATVKEHPDHLHTLKHHGVQSISFHSSPAAWLLASSLSQSTSARGHDNTDSYHQQRSDNSLSSAILDQHHYCYTFYKYKPKTCLALRSEFCNDFFMILFCVLARVTEIVAVRVLFETMIFDSKS